MERTPRRRLHRSAAVSMTTVVLCLAGAGPALADGIDLPLPSPSPTVTEATDLPPLPEPLQDTVDQASQTLGIDDATDDSQPKHHRQKVTDSAPTVTVDVSTSAPAPSDRPDKHRSAPAVPASPQPVTVPVGAWPGLRTVPVQSAPVTDEPPAIAPAQSAPTTTVYDAAASLPAPIDPRGWDPRMTMAILGTLLVGLLAAFHLRLAQIRVGGGLLLG